MTTQKPGETPIRPGEYLERGPRGGAVANPRQVTIEPGDDRLPPTHQPKNLAELGNVLDHHNKEKGER